MPECIGIVEPWTVPDDSTTSPAMIVSRRLSTSSTPIKHRRDRYATESARLLGVLDERLAGRDWVMGADDSIADIRCSAGVRNLIGFYEARELVGFDRFLHVQPWLDRGSAVQGRPQVTAV